MDENGFEADARALPAVSMILVMVSMRFYVELVKDRRSGPWAKELREELERTAKNMIPEGMSMEVETLSVEAALKAIDMIFNSVLISRDGETRRLDR